MTPTSLEQIRKAIEESQKGCSTDSEFAAYLNALEIAVNLLGELSAFETIQAPDGRKWPVGVHAQMALADIARVLKGER